MSTVELRQDIGGWLVRWNAEMAARAQASGEWPNRTVAEFALARAAAHPDRIQLVDGEHVLRTAELVRRAQRLAGYFVASGLQMGEVVSFQLPNWWEANVIDLACAMTGLVANPIVPINRDAEVTYMLNESRSRVMFVPETFRKFDYAAMMARIRPALRKPPEVVVVRGSAGLGFDAILASAAPLEQPLAVDPNAVKLLMYTSGTTGRPKGVLHSHNSFHADCIKNKLAMRLADDDVTFCPSPVTHVSGYLWALNQVWCGDMPAVMLDVWDAEKAFELMLQYRCAFMVGATPFLQDLVAVAARRKDVLTDLKSYMCGGASVPPSLIVEAAERFPNCLPYRIFGATEVPCLTGAPRSRQQLRAASETDGRINGSEIKIIDLLSGQPVAPGEEGEILAREPSMALGYARIEDNDNAYDEDGYFRTGDLGRIVDGDHILCTGRKKDLIIRSGENISAKEIEDVLYRSPKIAEVAVVSMPSRKTGEAICAFAVLRDGATMELAEAAALIQIAGLAKQKTPEHLEVVAELPKNPAGKVRKDLLRQQAAALVAALARA